MVKRGMGFIFCVIFAACSPLGNIDPGALSISDIQGCSHISSYVDQSVRGVIGVVTHKRLNGFTVQSTIPDELPCSSEAIFVFTNEFPIVMVGDLIEISGTVREFLPGSEEDHNLSITEIVEPSIKMIQSNFPLPTPISLDDEVGQIPDRVIENDGMTSFDINEDGLDYFESLESMLVEVDQAVVVAPRNVFNEIVVLPTDKVEGNLVSSTGAILNTAADENPETIIIKLPLEFPEKIHVGDRLISPITGIMDYSYGNYKVFTLGTLEFSKANKITDEFVPMGEGLTFVSYNVKNLSYFDDASKFKGIARHIVNYLSAPDVMVLHEVMDDSGSLDDGVLSADKTIMKLIDSIIDVGGPLYNYSDPVPLNNQEGGIEGGNIRSILLYRADKGISLEKPAKTRNEYGIDNDGFYVNQNPIIIGQSSREFLNTRKPSIWLLSQNGTQFLVVGVHLTSQGANTPEWGREQPPLRPEEMKRNKQASAIHDYLVEILDVNLDMPILIAGDMNDVPWSNTLSELKGNSFFDLSIYKNENEKFSYIYNGNAEQLDYLLINQDFAGEIVQFKILHLNSILDHEEQLSDHDPVIAEINLFE